MGRYVTLSAPGATGGDATQIVPSAGKGVKRTIIVHVQNSANVTGFFSKDRRQLLQLDAAGNIPGIPVGKNGATTPFTFLDWEGEMWGVAGLGTAGPATIVIEDNSISTTSGQQ